MKRLLFILLLMPLFVQAQTVIYTGSTTQTTVQKGGYGADRVFVTPLLDTGTINGLFPTLRDTGRITVNNGSLYFHDGVSWVSTAASSFDTTSIYQALADSTSDIRDALADTAALKQNYTDTLTYDATLSDLRDTARLKQNYTDTNTYDQTIYNSSQTDWKIGGNTTTADRSIGILSLHNLRFLSQGVECARFDVIPLGGGQTSNFYVQIPGSNRRVLISTIDLSMRGCIDGTIDSRYRWIIGAGNPANASGGVISFAAGAVSPLVTGMGIGMSNDLVFFTASAGRASFTSTGGFNLSGKLISYAGSTPLNGQIPIGDALGGVWTMGTITAGSNMSVVNGSASITISADTTNGVTKLATQGDITRALAAYDTTVTTASDITLSTKGWYSYSGTIGVWTLPVVSGNIDKKYIIKNRGSSTLTINSNAGGNDIYETIPVNTLVLPPGGSCTIWNDGTYYSMKN
jgi:hypothetical protein